MKRAVAPERYLVFVTPALFEPPPPPPPPEGVQRHIWRATSRHALPPGPNRIHAAAWSVYNAVGIFRNRAFGAVLYSVGGQLIHRTMVFPAYYAFPFMNPSDVQAGDIWTHPQHRGRGLARNALAEVLYDWRHTARRVWFVTNETNLASVRLAERVGLVRAGIALHRDPWLGPRGLGRYELISPAELSTA